MAGFEYLKNQLLAAGAGVVAASVDPIEKSKDVAAGFSFPLGYGVTRAQADQLGSWWEERRQFVQPSEFMVRDGKVLAASYSAGPLGRFDAVDVLKLIGFYEAQARK